MQVPVLARLTAPQIRAANSLILIVHSIKLMLLLSDEAQIASRRDAELQTVKAEKEDAKKVAALLNELFRPQNQDSAAPEDESMDLLMRPVSRSIQYLTP